MICGNVTKRDGRVGLGYLLNHYGMIKSEATVANLPASDRGPARVWYGSAAESETHDLEWLTTHVRDDEDVHIKSLTNDQTILVLAGPKARDVLSACARGDWSQKAFPWLSVSEAFVGFAPSTVLAVSFSGELAYEIHVPNASLYAAYLGLREAGKAHGMQLFGARAVNAMRIEKGFLHWKADLLTEFDPFETGLDRFVKLEKGDFVGRDALIRRQAKGSSKRLVTLEIATTDAPAHGGASVMVDDKVVGTITSGEWGHRVGKNLAYAFVNLDVAEPDVMLEVDMCGRLVSAKVIQASPYDSSHQLMRR
jgi:dimethylglycine dehydrogenase